LNEIKNKKEELYNFFLISETNITMRYQPIDLSFPSLDLKFVVVCMCYCWSQTTMSFWQSSGVSGLEKWWI